VLTAAACDLPVLYYAQYLDSWDVADSRFRLLKWRDRRSRQIFGSMFGLVFYPSRFCEDLLSQIKSYRKTRIYRDQSEDRWFLDHMQEAINAALWLKAPFLVVSISECLGPSRDNEEIQAALNAALGLSKRSRRRRPAQAVGKLVRPI